MTITVRKADAPRPTTPNAQGTGIQEWDPMRTMRSMLQSWDPFREMTTLRDEMNRLFTRTIGDQPVAKSRVVA